MNNALSLLPRTRLRLIVLLILCSSFALAQAGPPPVITSISPTSGPVGTIVTIHGFNFGSQQGDLYFDYDGITITPSSWSDTSVVATIPAPMYGSLPFDIARPDGGWSNYSQLFEVTSAPDFSPIESPIVPHGYLTLTGYIGKRGTNSRIRINGYDVAILMWNEQYAQVKLPDNIGPGSIAVAVRNEYGETTRNYTVALASGVRIQFDPSFQNFGTVTVGQSANATISIANIGSQDASVTSIAIEGSSEFTQSNGCGAQIYAGQSCSATISFAPHAVGQRSGYLLVTTATGTWRLPLVGSIPSTGVLAANMKIAGAADLSTGQKLDWVHWGYQGVDGVRKSGATPLITYSVIGTGTPESDSYNGQTQLQWSDGAAPNPTGSGSTSTLQFSGYAAQNGSGYRIVVPADTSTRTLKLYAGAFQGRVEVRAYLSDGSAAPFVDSTTLDSGDNYWTGRVIQFDYRAQSGSQTLTVELVMADRVGNYNNVLLQAATLEMAQPSVALTSPADHSVVTGVPATITLQATASQYDRSITKVEFYKNGTKIGESASSPYSLQSSITSGGDYVFVARAIDQNNLSTDSVPTTVHVVGSGGGLTGSAANSGGANAIDLSAGTSDWVHWGYDSVSSVNRKSGITPQISDYTFIGNGIPRWPYAWNTMFSWTDGTPIASVPYSLGAIQAWMPGQGFHLSIPASNAQKTLKLYLGLFNGEGTLRASLSDGSAVPYVVTDTDTQFYDEKVYAITFKAASPGQTLNVDYYLSGSGSYAGVYLESATLTVDDAVTFAPSSYDFGNVALGGSPTQSFTLTNNDTVARPIALSTSGSFTQNNSCPASLAAGATCTVTMTFTPPTTGQLSGSVTVTSGAYTKSAALFGTGVLPPAPVISIVAANPATRGSLVTVSGTNFGPGGQPGVLSLNGVQVPASSWNATTITFIVPANAVSGPLVVSNYGASSAPATLNVAITGVLTGKVKTTPGFVNLTADNALDWMHWGTSASEVSTRRAGANLLPEMTVLGSGTPESFPDSEIAYTWTDGAASASGTNSTTGLFVPGVGNGYRLILPASTTPRTVRFYVGTYRGTAQLTATLSDNSASAFSDTSLSSDFVANGVYELTFRSATDNQTLTIDYTLAADLGDVSSPGNVTLQSAELFPVLPEVSITAPPTDSVFAQNNGMTLTTTATQIDRPISSVTLNEGSTDLITLNNPPYQVSVNNAIAGQHVYTASAVDSANVTSTSEPVRVHVNAGGGTLTGSYGDKPAAVDLSQGTSDWVHWGNGGETRIDRKRCVTPQISNFTALKNKVYWYDNGITNYSWTGGRPADSVSDSYTGVYALDAGSGYRFTVAAGTDVRTLKFYVEADATTARVTATLSDGSAAPYVFTYNSEDYDTKVFTIQFAAASANQILTIEFESIAGHGYASLEAATVSLSENIAAAGCPSITSIAPAMSSPGHTLTITGSGFGSQQAQSVATLSGVQLLPSFWSDSTIVTTVPTNSVSGPIVVTRDNTDSNEVGFRYAEATITSISPDEGGYGVLVDIYGSNFGSVQGTSFVTISGAAAQVVSWGDSHIQVRVPDITSPGDLVVHVGSFNPATPFALILGMRGIRLNAYVTPDELTVAVGGTQHLRLVDPKGAEISSVNWTVEDDQVASIQQENHAEPVTFTSTSFEIKGLTVGETVVTGISAQGVAHAKVHIVDPAVLLSDAAIGTVGAFFPEVVGNWTNDLLKGVPQNDGDPAFFAVETIEGDATGNKGTLVNALDANGGLLWKKRYDESSLPANEISYPLKSAAMHDGGILVLTDHASQNYDHITIQRLNSSGQESWTKTYPYTSTEMAIAPDDTVYMLRGNDMKILAAQDGNEIASVTLPTFSSTFTSNEAPTDITNPNPSDPNWVPPCKTYVNVWPTIGYSSATAPIIGPDGLAYSLVTNYSSNYTYHNCVVGIGYDGLGHDTGSRFMQSSTGVLSYTASFDLVSIDIAGNRRATPLKQVSDSKSVTYSGDFNSGAQGFYTTSGQRVEFPGFAGEVIGDAGGGVLARWSTNNDAGITRVVDGSRTYTTAHPQAGSGGKSEFVSGESDRFFASTSGNFVAFNLADGNPLWSHSIYRVIGATDGGGAIVQLAANDDHFVQFDRQGNEVGDPIPLPRNSEYLDDGNWAVKRSDGAVNLIVSKATLNLGSGHAEPEQGTASATRSITHFVQFREHAACSGYSELVALGKDYPNGNLQVRRIKQDSPGLLVPTFGSNSLEIKSQRSVTPVGQYVSVIPASITPGSFVNLTVSSSDDLQHVGQRILLKDSATQQAVGSFIVDIYPRAIRNVQLFAVEQPAPNNPLTPFTVDPTSLTAELHRIYLPQTNVELNVNSTILPLSCNYDTLNGPDQFAGADNKLHVPDDRRPNYVDHAGPQFAEVNKVTDCFKAQYPAASNPDLNDPKLVKVFHFRELDHPADQTGNLAFALGGDEPTANPQFIYVGKDPFAIVSDNYWEDAIAHELGHHFGLTPPLTTFDNDWHNKISIDYLMWPSARPQGGQCRLSKAEWRAFREGVRKP